MSKPDIIPRELSKKQLERCRPWAEKQHSGAGKEKTVDELLEMLSDSYRECSKVEAFKNRSAVFLLKRAKMGVVTKIKKIGKLDPMQVIILGPSGTAMDFNARKIAKVNERAKKGPSEVHKLVEEDKIAWVMVTAKDHEGNVIERKDPITKLNVPMKKNEGNKRYMPRQWADKEKGIRGYELWEPGDPVIPIDNRKEIKEGLDNWAWGEPLGTNWGMTFLVLLLRDGAACPELVQFRVYGNAANPEHSSYIEPKLRPYYGKLAMLKAKLKNNKYGTSISLGKGGSFAIKAIKAPEFDIYDAMYSGIGERGVPWVIRPAYTGNPFDGEDIMTENEVYSVCNKCYKPYREFVSKCTACSSSDVTNVVPPLVETDVLSLREYHEKIQSYINDDGEMKKNYSACAMMECTIYIDSEGDDGKSIRATVIDASGAERDPTAFFPKHMDKVPFDSPGADVLMIVQSNKSDVYYDVDLRDQVDDVDGTKGDMSLNIIAMWVIMERSDDDRTDGNMDLEYEEYSDEELKEMGIEGEEEEEGNPEGEIAI